MVSMFIDTGVFTILVMASLPLLMHWCVHHCQASAIAFVACSKAGVVALIVMASLLLMRRHLCCCCNGNCHSRHNGVVTVVNAQAPPLLSS